jgi:hypothetical protein
MKCHSRPRAVAVWTRTCLSIGCLTVAAAAARAQYVPLGGNVYDGAGGPLLSGTVYHAVNHLAVPDGKTLTVEPGAILKFGTFLSMTVNGTLDVAGTAASPVVFSSVKDDLAGGDTNGDAGATAPAPGDWDTLVFGSASDASVLDHLDLRYAGVGFYGNAGITLSSANITMRDCVVQSCGFAALNLSNTSYPDVRSSTFHGNGGRAVASAGLRAVAGFVDNTAYGNAGGNYMHVVDGSVGSDLEITAGNCLGGALVLANHVTVVDGATLTLDSGVVFKFDGPLNMTVQGTLITAGTLPSPVVLTSLADDSVAGDTNNNGPSSGSPGEWIGLALNPNSDASSLYNLEVRHAGHPFYAMAGITLSSSDAELESCTIRDCAYAGLDLSNNSLPTVTACAFQDNGGGAVRNATIEAVPGFTGNTSSGNAGGDCIDVPGDATVAWDLAVSTANCPGGALVIGNNFGVVAGATWTLEEGVVLKIRGALKAEIEGTLQVNGTAASPVVITSIGDDSAGGDTNKNGPSSGAPGDWIGMYFRPSSDASYANYLDVRHAGWAFYAAAGITLDHSDAQLANCTIRDCAYAGLDLASYGGQWTEPTITDCSFVDNGGVAVTNVAVDAVPGFLGNTASGNGGGDYLLVGDPSAGSDTAIAAANCLNGALVLVNSPGVPAGVRLSLGPGVVIKLANTASIPVYGALDLSGTPSAPVVFTSFADDAYGGDTNGDGSVTLADKAAWSGIAYLSASDASTADNVLIRYAGYNGAPGLLASAPLLAARSVRVEHCATDGIEVWAHSGDPQSWIAYDCDGYGIELWGGAFDLRHATVHDCGAGGIRDANWAFAGGVVDSIAWGNLGANFTGFGNGDVRYSDGDRTLAGANGNIDTDPLFVDAAAGDLHLQAASPCIDAGDPLSALDPDGTRTDMGAYAFDQCAPFTYCTPKANPLGCAMAIGFSGLPSTSGSEPFLLTVDEAISNKNGLLFYGKSGPNLFPYQGGYFCAKGPFKRTPMQSSGGNFPPEDCSGSFSFDFNAWIQSGKDPFLVPGVTVNAQFWCRNGAANTVELSDAVQFRICQ